MDEHHGICAALSGIEERYARAWEQRLPAGVRERFRSQRVEMYRHGSVLSQIRGRHPTLGAAPEKRLIPRVAPAHAILRNARENTSNRLRLRTRGRCWTGLGTPTTARLVLPRRCVGVVTVG